MRILTYCFFGAALLLFFALFFHSIIEFDQDLGRHLLMGEIILETGNVPQVNFLSYTHPTFPFINSHWLSEVVFFLVGVPGVLYLKILVLCSAFLLTLYTGLKYSKNLAATALGFLLFVPVLLERTEIRPEIFSYLFISIFVWILLLDKRKLLWALPIVQLFWVNAHIYFILGPALTLIYAIAKRNRQSIIIFMLCSLACLVNPNFISGAIYPLRVFDNYGYSIVENQNLFFLGEVTQNINITYFWIAAVSFVISWFVSKKITVINLLFSILIILPILHIRSFPLLFLILLPVFAFNLANSKISIKAIKPSYVVIFVIVLTLTRFVRLATDDYYSSIDSQKRFGSEIHESGKGAVDFVLRNKLKGPVFNNFDNGSYLDYRLYPKEKVFVDGRPEAYPVSFFQNVYIPMQMTTENFNKVDEIYKFNTIIFAHSDITPWGSAFLTNIIQNNRWHLAYLDTHMVVFTKRNIKPTIVRSDEYVDLLRLASVSSAFGWTEEMNRLLQAASFKKPKPGMVWF